MTNAIPTAKTMVQASLAYYPTAPKSTRRATPYWGNAVPFFAPQSNCIPYSLEL